MVVTADKGLAGSYNHNILKIAEEELAKHRNVSCMCLVKSEDIILKNVE